MSSKQHLFLEHSKEVASNKISSWDTLRKFHPNNISFEATLRSCILKTLHLRQLFGVVFPHFHFRHLCRNVSSRHFLFKAIIHNCILKIFTLRQFYVIVFSKYFLQDNSSESYYTKVSLRQSCWIVFSKYSLQDNSLELYPYIPF